MENRLEDLVIFIENDKVCCYNKIKKQGYFVFRGEAEKWEPILIREMRVFEKIPEAESILIKPVCLRF